MYARYFIGVKFNKDWEREKYLCQAYRQNILESGPYRVRLRSYGFLFHEPLIVGTYNTHTVDLCVFSESMADLNFRTQHGELISMFYNLLMVSTEEVYCLTDLMVQSVFVTVEFPNMHGLLVLVKKIQITFSENLSEQYQLVTHYLPNYFFFKQCNMLVINYK